MSSPANSILYAVTYLDGACYWPSNKQYLYQPVASRDGRNPTDDLFRAAAVFHGYEKHLLGYEFSDLLSRSYAEVNDRQMLWLASQPSSLRVVISFLKPTLSGFRVAPRHHFNLNWVRTGF